MPTHFGSHNLSYYYKVVFTVSKVKDSDENSDNEEIGKK